MEYDPLSWYRTARYIAGTWPVTDAALDAAVFDSIHRITLLELERMPADHPQRPLLERIRDLSSDFNATTAGRLPAAFLVLLTEAFTFRAGYAGGEPATDLDEAWAALHAATPAGWRVGPPYFHDECGRWEQWAYLRASRGPIVADWIAVGDTEVECVREMAHCLCELGEGRWPG